MSTHFGKKKWISAALAMLAFFCNTARLEDTPPPPAHPTEPASRYPTIKLLDFALDRKLAVDISDTQCGGAPLALDGVTLPKPVELPIDLPSVLRLAGCESLDVRIACARLDEAHARTLAAQMHYLPTLQPYYENTWHSGLTQASNGVFSGVHKEATQTGFDLKGEWHVGETFFQVLAAKRRAVAGEANVLAASELARLQAVNGFFNLVQAQTDFAIAQQRLKEAEETLTLTQNLVKGGRELLSEVKRAQAILAEVKQRVASAREKLRTTSLALTDALHIDPLVTLIPIQESQDLIALISPSKELPELVSDGLSRRPELRESRALWRALDAERRAAFLAPLIPAVYAEVSKGALGEHPTRLHRSDDYGAGLRWNIGPGGIGDVSRTRISEAQLKQESIRFAQVGDRVAREVVENFVHIQTTKELIDLSKEEIDAAEESLRLSNARLKDGRALTLEVTTAEDALFDAKSRAANNVTEYNKAQYALLRSIGGFREADCQEPGESTVPVKESMQK